MAAQFVMVPVKDVRWESEEGESVTARERRARARAQAPAWLYGDKLKPKYRTLFVRSKKQSAQKNALASRA